MPIYVSTEVIVQGISKISVFRNYTVHVLECYVSYCVKTRIHWGKRQSPVESHVLVGIEVVGTFE